METPQAHGGNSRFSGHPGDVGHVTADSRLAFILTCRREAAKSGGRGDLMQVAAGVNNLRSSVDSRKSGLRSS